MAFIRGLQAGFGDLLGAQTLADLRAIGVQLVRLDCQKASPKGTEVLVREVLDAGMVPYPIIRDAAQLHYLPPGLNVELMNEPDLNGPTPVEYERAVLSMAEHAEDVGVRLWAGCISNLNQRGLRYLRAAGVKRWPDRVAVSVHWYPHGDSNRNAHPGFISRDHEVAELRALIGDRPWGVSEFGFHTTARKVSWLDRWIGVSGAAWTDAQVAAMVAGEWAFWEEAGAVGAVLYQVNDGPSAGSAKPAALDTFGIRRLDGSWKPVAATFARS
jgi:hypothetical protein